MQKQLFFDDNGLFSKENVSRDYGKPSLVGEYKDDDVSTDFSTGWVFKTDDGKYRLLYFGHSEKFENRKLFSAISTDGISFTPEELFDLSKCQGKQFSHEVMDIGRAEIASIYEDKYTDDESARYKFLKSRVADGEMTKNEIYGNREIAIFKDGVTL